MKTVLSYYLNDMVFGKQTFYAPKGAEVLSALNTSKGLSVFVAADSTTSTADLYTFIVVREGELFDARQTAYIASYPSNNGDIHHLFRII